MNRKAGTYKQGIWDFKVWHSLLTIVWMTELEFDWKMCESKAFTSLIVYIVSNHVRMSAGLEDTS